MTEQRLQPPYDPSCVDCRRDAGKDAAGTAWQCVGHAYLERDRLRADLAQARAELDTERGNADLLTQRVHERDSAMAQLKRDAKREQGFTNSYITRLHEAEATIATLREERDEARLEAKNAYNLFPPLLHAIDVALNGPAPDGVMRGYSTLPRQVEALRAALTAAQEALQFAASAFPHPDVMRELEPDNGDKTARRYQATLTQDSIERLYAAAALAQPAPAQGGEA